MRFEEAAARRGARYLDRTEPGWAEGVAIPTLDMSDGTCCILGQTNGDYFDHLDRLKPNLDDDQRQAWAIRHGFHAQQTADGKDKGGSWERLALAWAPLIAIRQLRADIRKKLAKRR